MPSSKCQHPTCFPRRAHTWSVATSAVAASCTARRLLRLSLYGFRSGPNRSQSSAWITRFQEGQVGYSRG